ncbi:site-2 protease family protein [Salininema proteolyticum]|uniref:Zinc metalloprotease n=1 Tax=Salininema proteolyticum TaxID=1607685 RepID=A0ABV8U374_9ACTN
MSALLSFRRSGLTIARFKDIPVTIGYSWFLLAVLIIALYAPIVAGRVADASNLVAYAYAALFAVMLLTSVFLHELGHALTARHYRIGVRSITLDALGGFTEMDREAPKPGQAALIALAGPAVSAVLGILFLLLTRVGDPGTLTWLLALQMAVANLLVAAYNLLPGLPLDGGKAVQSAIWSATKNEWTGYSVAGWIGRGVAVLTGLAGMWLYFQELYSVFGLVLMLLVAVELWRGAGASIEFSRRGETVRGLKARELARPIELVAADRPLGEALAAAEGRIMVVVADSKPVGIVDEAAAAAVEPERVDHIGLEGLMHPAGAIPPVEASLEGRELLRSLSQRGSDYYWVLDGDQLAGVLRADDVVAALQG